MSHPFELARVEIAIVGAELGELPAEEREIAARLGGARRQAEWVAGRLAARAALARLGPLPPALTIGRDEEGAPQLAGWTGSPVPQLSISHGRTAAVAVAGRVARLGVDLCDHDDAPRVRRVAHRFLAAEERALVPDGDAIGWATLWALKEAAAKALRRGLLDGGLRATRLLALEPPCFSAPELRATVLPAVLLGSVDVVAVVWTDL